MLDYWNPAGWTAISGAVFWVQSTLLGTIASAIAMIAVATIGLLMLSGRLDLRRGACTVLGCFLIFGAPTIAAAFMTMAGRAANPPPTQQTTPPPFPALPASPPRDAIYDPYAGAAVPRQQ